MVAQKQRGGRRSARWFVPATRFHAGLRNMAMKVLGLPAFARLLSPLFSLDGKGFSVGQ
jgi:hypothetical protein